MSESFDYRPSGMLAATGCYPDFNVVGTAKSSSRSAVAYLKQLHMKATWLQYEVDPEWSRFCSFGPDDIGGPWEKLGVIRRKPIVDVLRVSPDVMEQLKDYAEKANAQAMPFPSQDLKTFYGIPVEEDLNLPSGTAIGMKSGQPDFMNTIHSRIHCDFTPSFRWPSIRKYDNV